MLNTPDKKVDGLWVKSYGSSPNRSKTRAGCVWHRLNTRTRVNGAFQKRNPTYVGVSNSFRDFQQFADWCQTQFGYMEIDEFGKFWSLDKDLLVPGNKIYSPKFCCFVPAALNTILLAHTNGRGEFPLGVHKAKREEGYIAQASSMGRQQYLGTFDSAREAHREWQLAKIAAFDFALDKYSYLPTHILKGIRRHRSLVRSDYRQNKETLR